MKANIKLDKCYTVSKVDDRIFGSFVEHLGRSVYGGIFQEDSPLSDENGFRKDVLELVRELQVPVVRYPGGNFVSGYNWEDGIGDRDSRPRRAELAWGTIESNRFGLNEFADWCRQAGTKPLMAVNLGTRGEDEARQLVEYCNLESGTYFSDLRRSHGYAQPHNIKMWCLGNEMDGTWQIGHKDAEEYGRLAARTARVMRMVDPEIELVACGSSGFGMKTFAEWEATVLEQCYDDVNYISLHTYYGNQDNNYYEFLSKNMGMDRYIEAAVSACDYAGAKLKKRRKINLSFDEWNVWFHSHEQDRQIERWSEAPHQLEDVYTFEDALLVGGMLITLLRHADRVKIACMAQLVNVIAPIMTSDTAAWKQTIFYPLLHASRYGRGTALNTLVDSPVYESRENGDVPYLDSIAVMSDDGAALTVFALNRSLDEDIDLECVLGGFENLRVVEHTVLTHYDIKAENTEKQPNNVVPARLEGAKVDAGVLTARLPKKSWNVIRIG